MNVKVYKCFISSPSDTDKERALCDLVFNEINKTLGQQLKFRLESIKWESDSRPGFGEDSQTLITEQLMEEYDLFIGIMWNRFGTKTKRFESGTEEEFNHAYERHLKGDAVEIMFYFNDEPVSVSSIDIQQLQKVKNFKEKISNLGSLYCSYNGANQFREKLQRHLHDLFVVKLRSKTNDPEIQKKADALQELALRESVSLILRNRLNEALCIFSNQPIFWVDPVLSKTNKISKNSDENYSSRVELAEIIRNPKSTIIKSPPQFGLTCLAHYFVKEAWNGNSIWIYLDAKKIHRDSVESSVRKELKALNLEGRKIDCIVLDSWSSTDHGAKKLLKNICNSFQKIPIIVMQTVDDSVFKEEDENEVIRREFSVLHLLALPRTEIRKVVSCYNNEINIGDEDVVLEKVVKDLDVLNIHRTPLNCITLLKVSEKNFDESPVNRTKMIEMVLFVLFDLGELPTYKIRPDVKDCEYVLGRFCEGMIRTNSYQFTREYFIKELDSFCREKLLNLEVSLVFDILYDNNGSSKNSVG